MKLPARGSSQVTVNGIREIIKVAVQMPDVIHLEVGEPNFPTAQHIVDGLMGGVASGFTKYGPSGGLPSLRKLIAEKISRVNGYQCTAENVVVGIGAAEVIAAAMVAVVEPGEEVLIPDPAWPNYEMNVLMRGAKAVHYPLLRKNGFVPCIEDLEQRVTDRTKLLVINSPSNPAGTVFPQKTVQALVEFVQKHDLYLLADEVYDQLIYEGEHVSPAAYEPERTLSVYSFSKTYAMTGWRVGYIVTNEQMAELIIRLQAPLISSVPAMLQKAAEAALTGPQDCVQEMRNSYRERRDAVTGLLKARGYYIYTPRGAFYMLVDVSQSGLDSRSFALGLLEKHKVATAPGTAFGDEGQQFVRVSLATEKEQLVEGVNRLCDYIDTLAGR